MADDMRIPFTMEEIQALVGDYTQFTGRASAQTSEYIEEIISPLLATRKEQMRDIDASLSV